MGVRCPARLVRKELCGVREWEGPRIRLRAMVPEDFQLFESFEDDDIPRLVDRVHFPRTQEQRAAWFRGEMARERSDDGFRWVAETRDPEPVGTIDTFDCNPRFGTFKYGLAMAPPHQGRGYAAEMIFLVLRYYFHELRYQKVTPHVYSFNQRSLRLHETMGFVQEGRLRNMVYTRGEFHDEIYFGMTRGEFEHIFRDALAD